MPPDFGTGANFSVTVRPDHRIREPTWPDLVLADRTAVVVSSARYKAPAWLKVDGESIDASRKQLARDARLAELLSRILP